MTKQRSLLHAMQNELDQYSRISQNNMIINSKITEKSGQSDLP